MSMSTSPAASVQQEMTNMNGSGQPEQQGDIRAAGLYMLISILLIFFNKATFSYYHFAAPNVLTLSQNVCSLLFLVACKKMRLVEFHDFSLRNFRRLLPLGLTFIAYMVFGMIAMKVVNIPMYTTLRRTTVVFVMLLEWLIARKTSSLTIKVSVCLMIVGAMIAGVRDLNFDLVAYLLVVVYNLCTALYLVLINHISTGEKNKVNSSVGTPAALATQKLDKYDFMFYNNLISIPLLSCIILGTGEMEAAVNSPFWSDHGFLTSLLASSVLAFALNYTIFWNTAVNSALTQTVSGQAKDVVVVLLGFTLFDDAHFDPINMLGVTIGFGGSILYAMSKIVPGCNVEPVLARLGLLDVRRRDVAAAVSSGLPFTASRNGDDDAHETDDNRNQSTPSPNDDDANDETHQLLPNRKHSSHSSSPSALRQ